MTRLVIVESPTKAKTIRGFLPKDYQVVASMGHVRDLPESASEIPAAYKDKEWARLGVNVAGNFEPLYVIPSRKKKVVQELKEALKGATELILATDEDREGESIGWHLQQVLKPKVPIRRMVFHEITREAIQEALRTPRAIDEQLVRAQETRRILDRLVGYTLSPLLWKKIAPGLSAGRVQSVAVRLLVMREEQRRVFVSATYWDLKAALILPREADLPFEATLQTVNGVRVANGKDFDETTGKLVKGRKVLLLNETEAKALCARLLPATWEVRETAEKQQIQTPPPPFTTSTLQQEANRKLRMSSKQTMQIAQKLYEEGYITYMRTDSVHLSNEAISAARQAITTRYGQSFLSEKPRQYATKSKGAQEAHEAIRPAGTAMKTADEHGLSGAEAALYTLIWTRTIASQMAEARITLLTATIGVADATFAASGRRIDFPGFLRAYVEGSDDPDAALGDREVRLPNLQVKDALTCKALKPAGHETQPPARFTEAALVQTLEKEGIGRPSTYAAIISTIMDRGYVVKAGNALVPTFTAYCVNRLLEGHFPDLVDTGFTARMEQSLDDIAEGQMDWLPYLKAFYTGEKGLEKQVEQKAASIDPREMYALTIKGAEAEYRVRIGRYGPYLEQVKADDPDPVRVSLPENLPPAELTPEVAQALLLKKEAEPAALGTDPQTGEPVYLLEGRFGPYVQLGRADPNDKAAKPRRASLPKGTRPDEMTLEKALSLLRLPRLLGVNPSNGQEVSVGVGRFGPFVRCGEEFRSLTAADDLYTISLDRALELLSQPKGGRARRGSEPLRELGAHPSDGAAVVLMAGPYGPYVRHEDVIAGLTEGMKPETITLAQAVALLKERGKPLKAKAKGKAAPKKAAPTKTDGVKPEPPTKAAKQPAAKTPAAKTPAAKKPSAKKTPQTATTPKKSPAKKTRDEA
jgi:DNA topoisomerase-1